MKVNISVTQSHKHDKENKVLSFIKNTPNTKQKALCVRISPAAIESQIINMNEEMLSESNNNVRFTIFTRSNRAVLLV